MRHNGKPILFTSKLRPTEVTLFARGGRPLVVCRECGVWKSIKRGMVVLHYGPDWSGWPAELRPQAPICNGTGQRVRVDEDFATWTRRLREASGETGRRRATRVLPRPKPPVAPAIHQLAAAR
ncbi:hypothetical protein ACFVH6_30455 [Spirillospora sp. NPDC127200]